MRIPLRSFATFLMAVGVATCSDTHSTALTPATGPNGSGVARLGFQPVFSPAAAAAFANLADFAIDFDHVRVSVIRPPSETVKDTLIAFRPGQAAITLDLTVPVRIPGEVFKVTIDYVTTQTVVFHGEGTIAAHAPDEPAPPQQITIVYSGPGFNVARVVVAPKTVNVISPAPTTFTFSAFDAANVPITNVPINWTSSDATVATISATGVLTPTGKRGTVTVTALTPNNVSDNASAAITLPPTSIALVSGGGQTGKAGVALSQAATVKVSASDGVGVPGITVNFAAPTGGRVGSATVTTDATGQATTSLTLGGALGPQSFVAVAGNFSVAIPATATAGDAASITASSGGGQIDTVRHVLKNPLVAKVVDQFGNAIPNIVVAWTRAGTGTLSATSSTTSATGLASVGYTLGTAVGTETISAAVAGLTTPATFAVQAVSAVPAAITVVSGTGQSGRAGQPLSSPFVVRVADDAGNAVSGATVSWTAVNGTIPATTTTDAQGNSSNTLTLGSTIGNASATATVSGKSVSFTAAVQVGVVARLAFRANPPNGSVGQSLTPAVQVELQDAGGNRTAAVNTVTIALGANPGKATLTGTLTRAAVAGVATFDDLQLSVNGTGYTLVASSAGVPSIASTPFDVGGVVNARMIILAGDNQTAAVNTAVATRPSVRVTDLDGGSLSGVTVSFTTATGTVVGNPAITDCGGVATLTSWTLGPNPGPQSLTASTPGATSVTFNATATSATANTMLVIDPTSGAQITGTIPPMTVTAGATLPANTPVVRVVNSAGQPVEGVPIVVGVSGPVPTNVTINTDKNGVVSFLGITASTVAGTYNIVVSGAGLLGSPRTATVTVVPGPAAFHQWIQQVTANSTVTSGSTFPTTTLGLYDQYNNLTTTSGVTIGITLDQTQSTNANAQLGGTTTAQTVNGVATFNALTVTLASGSGAGYRLRATNLQNTANPGAIFGNPFGIGAPQPATQITSLTPTITSTVPNPIQPGSFPSFKVTSNSGGGVPGVQLTIRFQGSTVCVPANPNSTVITTDANGIATLTNQQVTFPSATPGSCLVTADAPAFDINTAYSNIVFGAASGRTWTGATDFSWTTAGNWLPVGVPLATDQVFIAGWVQRQPQLATSTTIAGLTIEPTSIGTLNIVGNFVLTINGSYTNTTSSGGIFNTVGSGSVLMTGQAGSTISGLTLAPMTIGSPTCSGTSYLVTGLSSARTLTVNCPLDLGAAQFSVTGDATVQNSGLITMTQANASLSVAGNASFLQTPSEVGRMTAGVVLLAGDLNMASGSSFSPSGTQLTTFSGSGGHTVTLGGLVPATFQNVIISAAEDLTIGAGSFTIAGTFTQLGSIVVSIGSNITLTRGVLGSVNIGGTTTLNGTITVAGANSTFLGTMFVNGQLTVSGANSAFLAATRISGTGGMSVQTPCTKSTSAVVSVGDPASPFTAAACTPTTP